jgi:molybdopterin molybdotransferase/putative molybdopterin biosynthesis protein
MTGAIQPGNIEKEKFYMYRKYAEPDFCPRRGEMTEILIKHVKPLTGREEIGAAESLGRVCAGDIFSKNCLPNTKTSRLDGIGVRFSDFVNGVPNTSTWQEGREFYFANTGTALADGFDTVILIEEIEFEDGVLSIKSPPGEQGEYVTAEGSLMREGELLVPEDALITPVHLGLLASGGVSRVAVLKRPTVVIIPSGDELTERCSPVPRGMNVESNSHMISGFLREWGAVPLVSPIIRDDRRLLAEAMTRALAEADAVILMAGSSKGTKDFAMEALADVGEIIVHELAHGPGKHSSLTMAGDKPIFGVAGPSLGAQLVSMLYLRLFINRMLRQPEHLYERVNAVLEQDFPRYDVDFCESLHVRECSGKYFAGAVMKEGVTRAQSAAALNAFLYRPAGSSYCKGDVAELELLVPRACLKG